VLLQLLLAQKRVLTVLITLVLYFVLHCAQALEALLRRDDGDGTIATLIDEADGTLSSAPLAIPL
jgi:hypothetical protein